MSYRDPKDHRDAVSPDRRDLVGRLRRMAITLTTRAGGIAAAIWQVAGHRDLEGRTETTDAEVFPGIGFWSRPKAGGKAEAVIVQVGGAEQPIVIATRNEDVRNAVLSGLAEDETAIYTSGAVVWIRADGTIEIRSAAGSAAALATKADIDALRSWVSTHVHTGVTAGGASSGPPGTSPPSAAGTTKLKAE